MAHGASQPSLSAVLRAKHALEAAGLDKSTRLVPATNTSNEVWFAGDHVVRVAAGSRYGRLATEAHVAKMLPAEVPHAAVVAHGRAALGEWVVMERVAGRPLSECWPALGTDRRRDAVQQLARALRSLHGVAPSAELLAMAHGDTPHPLPASRVLALIEEARLLSGARPVILDAASELVRRIASSFDPNESVNGIVHGDLHFDNILWDGDGITALLDLEWVRPGPPDLDLDVLLRYCQAPELSTQAADRFAVSAEDLASVSSWLEEDYPEMFSHPRLQDRLLLYQLAFDVRALVMQSPGSAIDTHPFHPYNRLGRTVMT